MLLLGTPACLAQTFSKEVASQEALLTPYKKQIDLRIKAHQPITDFILNQLKQNSLPNQLVLLPMLESSYNAEAISHAGARGLWQLMPATAERFGLTTSPNDQRLNVAASTKAALSYIKFLYNKFDGNLTLTLAAYNAGEGRVERAIARAGSREFHKLRLPQETIQYVHRFYALVNLINVPSINQHSFRPLMLFSSNNQVTTQPIINLQPLPPLIQL
ncbi:lytic transglycosylase domain-containing protein [Vibrio ziniensis]|uniref:lytic transglycosylase domain-containing protein n=1 Tax=Vibrio ziniensis TaxID=2711221 RepID=UPI001FE24E11|nr:lytic transglycosylase domain-containing protein [Vibrio ziniensis]